MRDASMESFPGLRARVRRDASVVAVLVLALSVVSVAWELPQLLSGHVWDGTVRYVAGHLLVVVAGAHLLMLGFGYRRGTDLKRAVRHNEKLALHDPLTGLANRVLLFDRLEQELAQSRRTPQLVGVLLLDLNGFKAVNDRYGHLAGDELLQQVARRLRGSSRDVDTVARFGGDEFVVLITGAQDPDAIRQATNRLVAAFDQPFDVHAHELRITPSLGLVVQADPDVAPDELLRAADAAMYVAKRAGGGVHDATRDPHAGA